MAVTYQDIVNNEEIRAYVCRAGDCLRAVGFTDHSEQHGILVADRAALILQELGYSKHMQELARIAGYMHDMGNIVSRHYHAECGGLLADTILRGLDISLEDRIHVVSAISHHDETKGGAVDALSAAIIIADKTDIHRNRVLNPDPSKFSIYERINYAIIDNQVHIDPQTRRITLKLELDETYSNMYEFFDTCIMRMKMSQNAVGFLDASFALYVNDNKIL